MNNIFKIATLDQTKRIRNVINEIIISNGQRVDINELYDNSDYKDNFNLASIVEQAVIIHRRYGQNEFDLFTQNNKYISPCIKELIDKYLNWIPLEEFIDELFDKINYSSNPFQLTEVVLWGIAILLLYYGIFNIVTHLNNYFDTLYLMALGNQIREEIISNNENSIL